MSAIDRINARWRGHGSEFTSPHHAALILGVSVKTVRRRIADGTIHAVRIGRLVRIPIAELDRLAARQ